MDEADLDLGGSNPVPITAGGRNIILALSKNGHGYLLDRAYLGGIGGVLIERHETSWPIITAPIFYGAGYDAMVVFQGHDEAMPRRPARPRTDRAARAGRQGPRHPGCLVRPLQRPREPISRPRRVRRPDHLGCRAARDGDGRLHGFRADTGAAVFSGGGRGRSPDPECGGSRPSSPPATACMSRAMTGSTPSARRDPAADEGARGSSVTCGGGLLPRRAPCAAAGQSFDGRRRPRLDLHRRRHSCNQSDALGTRSI